MVRDITFRGRYRFTGDWAHGYYVELHDGPHMQHRIYTGYADPPDFSPDWVPVDPDTIGQYTGVNDRNGKMIFEGDYIKDEKGTLIRVEYEERLGGFVGYHVETGSIYPCVNDAAMQSWSVVGNVHDGIPHGEEG